MQEIPNLTLPLCFGYSIRGFKLGTSGNLGYSSDGVRLEVAESLTDIFTDGTTMAVDSRRTEESILLTATLDGR